MCVCGQWWRVRLGVQWETRIKGKVHGRVHTHTHTHTHTHLSFGDGAWSSDWRQSVVGFFVSNLTKSSTNFNGAILMTSFLAAHLTRPLLCVFEGHMKVCVHKTKQNCWEHLHNLDTNINLLDFSVNKYIQYKLNVSYYPLPLPLFNWQHFMCCLGYQNHLRE